MLSITLTAVVVASVLTAIGNGSAAEAGNALMLGGREAVDFLLRTAPALCLWSGVLELLERVGGTDRLRRILEPVLGKLFPIAAGDEQAFAALTENVSANLLGLGNAATPAGIRAVRRMHALGGTAADEICLFVVLNTASLQLLPATIASLRAAAGAEAPFDILPAVLASSAISVAAGLTAALLLRRLWR